MTSAMLTAIAFGLSLAASVCYGAVIFLDAPAAPGDISKGIGSQRPARYATILVLAAIVVLIGAIGLNCVQTHFSPFAGEYGTTIVAAWAVSTISLFVDRRAKLPSIGALGMMASSILLAIAYFHAHGHVSSNPLLSNPIVTIHVAAVIASFGLVLVASGCAALYLLQDKELKRRSKNRILGRLPALTRLDAMAFQCVAYALPLLTLAIGVAFVIVFSGDTSKSPAAWFADPNFIASAVLWALFTAYLAARLLVGWRGVKLQYILLIGILCAFAAYALPTASAHHFN